MVDINAFALPAPYSFGNSGRNVLIGPGVNLLEGAISKEFATTETQRLEFRAEFFNMLNHPNFSQPDNFIDKAGRRGCHRVVGPADAADPVRIEV